MLRGMEKSYNVALVLHVREKKMVKFMVYIQYGLVTVTYYSQS